MLWKSTEARDRGEKFADYRGIPTLTGIVFVSQYRMHVEHYVRQADGEWKLSDVTAPEAADSSDFD